MSELTRKCPRCLEVKPHSEYGFDRRSKLGVTTYCLPCKRKKDLAWQKANPERTKEQKKKSRLKNPVTTRAAQQRWNEANRDKLIAYSRKYETSKKRERKAAHPEIFKLYNRKGTLGKRGLTLEGYAAMLASQNNGCAICGGVNLDGRPLGVDHDHKCHGAGNYSCANCVRGLLCVHCNATLHKMESNKDWVVKALAYLEKYAKRE